jgi:hypothetical protein
MATVVSLLTSGTSTTTNTSQATASFNPASAGAASGILVFVYAAENAGTSGASTATTLTDSVSGRSVGTTFDAKTWSPTSAGSDGVTTGYYLQTITSTNNGSGSVTIATTASCRKAWAVYYITGFPSVGYSTGGAANTFGTGISSTTPTRTLFYNNVQSGAVTIGFLGVEGAASPGAPNTNTNGTWTTLQTFVSNGTGTTANGLATHVKIGTYTGSTTPTSITYNPTLGTAVDSQIGAIEIIPQIAVNPMAAPTVGAITSTTVDLTWVAPWQIAGGSWAVSNYIIEYRVTSVGGAWTQQSMGSTALSGTVTGPLTSGTQYDFNIKAVNVFGTSTTGAISSATTSAPAGPTVTTVSTTSSAIQPSVSTSVNISVSTIASTVSTTSPTVVSGISVTSSTVLTSSSLFAVTPVGAVIAFPPSISGVTAYPNLGVLTGLRYFRPSGDTSTGSWAVSPLWSKVDEVIYDDSDFITSEALTSGTTSIAKLALTLV